ncbi:ribosome quality control complex subunit 2-like [Oryza brachyantha]|uniref:ribosome quality control complex subunit 2-like n=1 Tax=Oryza brachyantha TaxID=4533 RepID=UPI001ADA55FE|nr:ribosome quality control complex subunit 2-like [Oryza brachyantha]
MASPSAAAKLGAHLPRLRDIIDHDDEDDDFVEEVEEEEEEEEEWEDMSKRMSRLSLEGSDGGDADDEDDGCLRGEEGEEEEEEDGDEVRSDVNGEYVAGGDQWRPYGGGDDDPRNPQAPSSASLPGTPDRGAPAPSRWMYSKEYASETEAARWPGGGGGGGGDKKRMRHRRERMMREVWLDRAWQMRKQRRQMLSQGQGADAVTVVVGGGGGGESPARGGVAMDMEEMRACRDLGLDLPCDWTVEIPCYALSGVDTASSGGNSPASGSWRISSPGDDPKDVKARLKVWAQAVALASASRLGS